MLKAILGISTDIFREVGFHIVFYEALVRRSGSHIVFCEAFLKKFCRYGGIRWLMVEGSAEWRGPVSSSKNSKISEFDRIWLQVSHALHPFGGGGFKRLTPHRRPPYARFGLVFGRPWGYLGGLGGHVGGLGGLLGGS